MKLRYIITTLVAAVALATSCQESLERHLAEVQVSSSYVAIPAAGGSKTITVTATDDWTINDIPEWLTVKPVSGQAGETEVTFTSAAATSTNQTTVHLVCSGKTQEINVLQQTAKQELPISTCAQVNSGEDGKTYRVKGTVTRIVNTTYGNMYISDDTGEVYVYGTLDASGAEKNFLSLGIEAGDIVTVEGPRTTYGGVIELVNVTVIEIEKSLIKVESVEPAEGLPLEGGTFTVTLTNKGDGVGVQIPEDAKSWLSVSTIASKGTTTMVGLEAAANEGGDRSATVVFATASGDKDYTAQVELSQKGAVIDVTVEEFLAAEEGDTQYRVSGVVTKISASSKYHNADITVASGDFAHSVLLYRTVAAEGNIEDLGIKEGDIVTVIGKRSSYGGTAQMAAGGLCENVTTYAAATVAEFLAAAKGETYAVSGEITKVENLSPKSKYNNVNITIKDGDNTLYLYRVTTFDQSDVAVLNPEVGGTITVAGERSEYNGTPQMGSGGVVLAYTAPAEDGGGETPDTGAYDTKFAYTLGSSAYDDGVATVNDVKGVKVLKIGTAKKAGSFSLTIPAGTKSISYYAVAWKDAATTLTFTAGETLLGSQEIVANDGATGQTPYTFTVADSDKYTLDFGSALTAETQVVVTTKEDANYRAILFGIQ